MTRDFSKPYTPAELEGLKAKFRKLPTYKPGGWVKASEIPAIVEFMEYPRTPEQVAAYQEYWEKNCGGVLTMEAFIESASVLYSTPEFAKDYAINLDTDGDGKLSRGELDALVAVVTKHDPKLQGKWQGDFVKHLRFEHEKVGIQEITELIQSFCEA